MDRAREAGLRDRVRGTFAAMADSAKKPDAPATEADFLALPGRGRGGDSDAVHPQATGVPRVRARALCERGVRELDQEKLKPLLRLKYGAITDAVDDLGDPAAIGEVFADFQRYLY